MKELNDIRVACVLGGTLSSVIAGTADDAATDMAIGGGWGDVDGLGSDTLSRLVGPVVSTVMGAIAGGTVGLSINAETAVSYLDQYRRNSGPDDTGRTTI